jgi:defect-in-organelle-trafficking protein DotA
MVYYLPLLPFIIFMFGTVGWLAATIEAMVAAPIVALGITHPEGQEVVGKADPAVLLLVNVFLRPSMMIIGLIAGIIMSYVSIWILNMGFFPAFGSVMASMGGLSLIFSLPAMVLIYLLLVISLLQYSFSLINVIPDKVLRWIGGQQEGVAGEVGRMQGEAQQGFKSGAKSVGEGVSSATKQKADQLGDRVNKKKQQDKEEKKGSVEAK